MSPGQAAYEKYSQFQLRIPRMEIRPPTWDELKAYTTTDAQKEWHDIAKAAIEANQ